MLQHANIRIKMKDSTELTVFSVFSLLLKLKSKYKLVLFIKSPIYKSPNKICLAYLFLREV